MTAPDKQAGSSDPRVHAQAARRRIAERQNDPDMLLLLSAGTWHYMRAKRWHFLRVLGMLALAAAAPLITFLWPDAATVVGAAAGAWVLVGRTALAMAERRDIRLGATTREQFDVDLFGLDWNSSLAGPRPAHEDVVSAAAHVRNDARLRNWYAPTGDAPWPLDVLLCQRSSAVWGRRTHYGYAYTVLVLGVLWFIVGLAIFAADNLSLSAYLVGVFLPSQPAFLDTIDLYRSHLRQSSERATVEGATDGLWVRGISSPGAVTAEDCRRIQDQVFRLRREGPQVPQWFYRLRRGSDERAMRAAVSHLLSQLPAAPGVFQQ